MNIKGIGVDIVNKSRFEDKDLLIERFLNDDEIILMNNLSSEERIDFISGR
jgi:phosphopantetheinyl transferase (holo-ACP synthase)